MLVSVSVSSSVSLSQFCCQYLFHYQYQCQYQYLFQCQYCCNSPPVAWRGRDIGETEYGVGRKGRRVGFCTKRRQFAEAKENQAKCGSKSVQFQHFLKSFDISKKFFETESSPSVFVSPSLSQSSFDLMLQT